MDGIDDPHGLCNTCSLIGCNRQRYFDSDTDRNHDFCGIGHFQLAVSRGEWEGPSSREAGYRTCSLPGCNYRVATGLDGSEYDFCGATHAARASSRGLGPVDDPHVERVIMGAHGWKLKLLKRTHSDYIGIRSQFLSQWRKFDSRPTLERIFQVNVSDTIYANHIAYREYIAGKVGAGDANVKRRFHVSSGNSLSLYCSL